MKKGKKVELNRQTEDEDCPEEDLDDIDFGPNIDMDKFLTRQNVKDEVEETEDKFADDGRRHVIEQRLLPTKMINGFCFRPITGWRNKNGGFEISKELISFNPKNVCRYVLILHSSIILHFIFI